MALVVIFRTFAPPPAGTRRLLYLYIPGEHHTRPGVMGLPHHAACLSGAHLKDIFFGLEFPPHYSFDFQRQRALLRASIGPPSKQAASCPRSQIGGSHWKQTPFGWYVAAILTAALIFVVQSAEKVLTSVCYF